MKLTREFIKGLWKENPVFRLALGLCPTLAVSTKVVNGIGMGAAATFVLVGSSIIISCVRRIIPKEVRIPCFIVIIATFVTIVDLFMKAYFPPLSKSLGIFVPLIVVNCIVLGRAEAFFSREPMLKSIVDALGMGLGFMIALVIISALREFLGTGALLGYPILRNAEMPLYMILAPGALLTIGLLIGFFNFMSIRAMRRK